MMKEVEEEGEKIYNVFPMRQALFPNMLSWILKLLVTKEERECLGSKSELLGEFKK